MPLKIPHFAKFGGNMGSNAQLAHNDFFYYTVQSLVTVGEDFLFLNEIIKKTNTPTRDQYLQQKKPLWGNWAQLSVE